MNKKIVFAGPVKTRSGYGARSRDICKSLINLGYDLKIVPIGWGTTPTDALKPDNPDDLEILNRIFNEPLTEKPDVFIHCTIPNEFQAAGKFNIGVTAGIETDMCLPEWIEGCNKMDLVLTSSHHSKKVFEQMSFEKRDKKTNAVVESLKLTTPCSVLIEGVDTNIFNQSKPDEPTVNEFMDTVKEKSAFIVVGHWLQGDIGADRKDIAMTIVTFLNAFKKLKNSEQPALILKTSMAGFSLPEKVVIEQKIRQCMEVARNDGFKGQLPSIYLLFGDMTDAEMNALYNHKKVKAMVSFTKGEGFGRPLLEFTTASKPIIASNWSGQTDFLRPEMAVLLPGTLNPVHQSAVNKWIIKESKWFTANYNFAGQLMLGMFRDYGRYLEMAEKQKEFTLNNFTLKNMENQLQEYLEKSEEFLILQNKPVEKVLKLPKMRKTNA